MTCWVRAISVAIRLVSGSISDYSSSTLAVRAPPARPIWKHSTNSPQSHCPGARRTGDLDALDPVLRPQLGEDLSDSERTESSGLCDLVVVTLDTLFVFRGCDSRQDGPLTTATQHDNGMP
jgi:hypothetical protein